MTGRRKTASSATADFATIAEFYAHVYALELEAGERYAELADQMEIHNNREVAALFRRLSEIEIRHASQVLARAGGKLERLPFDAYRWGAPEPPETTPFGEAHYLMTPYHALELALRNEERAEAFFRNAGAGLKDARLRKLAAEIADEEGDHVRLIRQWLAKYKKPAADWADDPDPSVYSE